MNLLKEHEATYIKQRNTHTLSRGYFAGPQESGGVVVSKGFGSVSSPIVPPDAEHTSGFGEDNEYKWGHFPS